MTSLPSSATTIPLPRSTSPHLTSGAYSYSLMPKISHSNAIIAVVEAPLGFEIIPHIASCVRDVVPEAALHDGIYTFKPCTTHASHPPCCPTLESFIATTVLCSGVQIPTLLGMFVLLQRLKSVLPAGIRVQSYCTLHRLFITTLILASKSLNDRSPSNDLWSNFSGSVFTAAELLSMEREMLYRLDYAVSIRDEVAVLLSAKDLCVALGVDIPQNDIYQTLSEEGEESDLETGHSRDATVTPLSAAAAAYPVHGKPVLLDDSDEAITFSIPETPQLIRSDSSGISSSSSDLNSSELSGERPGSPSLGTRRSLSSSISAPDLTSLRRPLFSRPNGRISVKDHAVPNIVAVRQDEAEEVERHLGYRLASSHETIDTSCSEQDDKARTTINLDASLSYSPLLLPSPSSASASTSTLSWSSSRSSSSVSPVSPALASISTAIRADTEAKMYQHPQSTLSSSLFLSVEPTRRSTPHLERASIPSTSTTSSGLPLPKPLMSLMDQALHRRRHRQRRAKDESHHLFRATTVAIHH